MFLIALCACGSDTTRMAAPDLAVRCAAVTVGDACSAGDYCYVGFEMAYACDACGRWTYVEVVNPYGCDRLLNCYSDCNQNPVQSCYDDCDTGATQCAQDLLKALGDCVTANCFQALDADSGMPFCDEASMDPTATPGCNDCYKRILGSGGACRAAQSACTQDKS